MGVCLRVVVRVLNHKVSYAYQSTAGMVGKRSHAQLINQRRHI